MAKNSQARIAANNRYKNKVYDTISFQAPRTERLNEQLNAGAARAGTSKAGYILDTLRARLAADGITPDMLPPVDDAKNGGNS